MRKAEAKYKFKLPEPKKYHKSWYYYPIEDESYPRYNPYKSSRAQMISEYPVDYYDNVRSYSVPIRSRRGRLGLT